MRPEEPAAGHALRWSGQRVLAAAGAVSEDVWLLGGGAPVRLAGRLASPVARSVDGRRDLNAAVAAAAAEGTTPMEAYAVLMRWWRDGHLDATPPAGPPTTVVGAGPVAEGLASALAEAGLTVRDGAPVAVVLVDDLIDASSRPEADDDAPWLPVVLRGSRVLVGPLLGPGAGCHQCLSARVRERRAVTLAAARLAGLDALPALPMHPAAVAIAAAAVAADAHSRATGGVSDLDSHCVSIDVRTMERIGHRLVPIPGCARCDPRGRSLLTGAERIPSSEETSDGSGLRSVDPEATWRAYSHLVSDLLGVIPEVRLQEPADLRVFHSGANPVVSDGADLQALRETLRGSAGGKGVTEAASRAGALAEAIERRSMVWVGDEPVVRSRIADLEGAIHPNAIQLFSDAQLADADANPQLFLSEPKRAGFHRVPRSFDADREWDWVRVTPLAGGGPVWILATLAWLRHPDGAHGGPRGCSNGVAAGNTREEAMLQGLLELVERDAVALWWYPRAERPAFEIRACSDPRITAALAPLHRLGRDVWVLDVTSDLGIPAAAAVSALPGGTRLLHGFGAHLDPVVAVVRALTEVAQMEAASLAAPDAGKDGASLEQQWMREVTTLTDPWLAPHGTRPLTPRPVHRLDDALSTVIDRLTGAGLTPYRLDLTRRDLRLPVVRIIVPGLRHFWNRFGPGRLYDVPPLLGGVTPGYGEADLNPRWVFI